MSVERTFQVVSPGGLDRNSFPLRLFEKSKRDGIWNPSDLDFSQDRQDWLALTDDERDVLLRLTSLFAAGEESVALDLLPLIQVIAAEGRLEEELYLTSFLWEEAKHVDLFRRFVDEVAPEAADRDLGDYHGPSYRQVFADELPRALGRLRDDPSPQAQAEASVTYNMIVEGVLAETGYHGYGKILDRRGLLPGMRRAVRHLEADESRHMAYGVYLLCRLVAEHGEPLWETIERRMGELLPAALGVIEETFEPYGDQMPFGLDRAEFVEYGLEQFQRRTARIELARDKGLAAAFTAAPESGADPANPADDDA